MRSGDIDIINARVFHLQYLEQGFLENSFVSIRGKNIETVGAMTDYNGQCGGKTIDAHGALVMPGLVNAHVHGAMTLFRGMADDLPLMAWLENHIFPAEARFVNADMVYWSSKLAAAEMILSGTTTVADAYFFENEAARAFSEAGMRSVAAHGIIDFPAPGVPDPAENIAAVARFIERWQGHDRIRPAVFAHSPYTCSSSTLQKAKELACLQGVPFFIHLAETAIEKDLIAGKWQGSPTSYLHSLGILDRDTVCVHAVWLDAKDVDIVAETGASVILCPQSNMKLASGVAPFAALENAGVRLGLGTDGCASNNNLDMFGEMDLCAKLQKVHSLDPTIAPARALLRMATEGGAGALRLDSVGTLAPGQLADIIIVDLAKPHLTPFHSVDTLVYAGGGDDVKTVIINGKLVMEDRKILTFDVAEAMEKVVEMARKIKVSNL